MVYSPRVAKTKPTSFVVGAITAGALAAAGLGSAPTASATCASFFGIGNSPNCTSNPTSIAIALGPNATALATGLFSAAFSIGTTAYASTFDPTINAFDFAVAVGDSAQARATGVFGLAAQFGNGGYVTTGAGSFSQGAANVAISVTVGNVGIPTTYALGIGNIAVNLFGNASAPFTATVGATGILNMATNFGGIDNKVFAGAATGSLNGAFSAFGNHNTVTAGPGPLAVAGSILQTGATVTKQGPGFNINNGIVVGGAAAVGPHSTATRHANSSAAATAGASGGKTAAHATAGSGRKKT